MKYFLPPSLDSVYSICCLCFGSSCSDCVPAHKLEQTAQPPVDSNREAVDGWMLLMPHRVKLPTYHKQSTEQIKNFLVHWQQSHCYHFTEFTSTTSVPPDYVNSLKTMACMYVCMYVCTLGKGEHWQSRSCWFYDIFYDLYVTTEENLSH